MKIKSPFGLTEAKCGYSINISIDEEYFAQRVEELNNKIKNAEAKPDMFEDYKGTIQSLKDNIKGVELDKKEAEELEIEDFTATVSQVDFSKDTLLLEIPEEVVADIIKLRHNVEAYVVNLK